MREARIMGLSFLLILSGCSKYVDRSRYEDIKKQLDEARTQLQDVQQRLKEERGQKFSTFQSGFRTWRFDQATGDSCILVTTDSDWKNSAAQEQSCDCKDFMIEYLRQSKEGKPEARKELEQWRELYCGRGPSKNPPAGAISRNLAR